MAPSSSSVPSSWFRRLYVSLSSRRYDVPYVLLLLAFECLLCVFIVKRVAYTEIDWIAYVEQVETYQSGERDYMKIRGPTGPLVYPAGFLYVYSLIKWLAELGLGLREGGDDDGAMIVDYQYDERRIRNAQNVFVLLYVCNAAVVSTLYTMVARAKADKIQHRGTAASSKKTDGDDTNDTVQNKLALRGANLMWSWRFAMALLCLSKRLHSIFVLRLFNDGVAMLFFYISALLFTQSKWRFGCIMYSLAVGVKMNVLLFAPGLLLLLLQGQSSLRGTIECLSICAAVQLALGWPFLSRHPVNYVRKAFEFDRVFMYRWTVNWKFLSEEVFVSKKLSVLLLALHLSILAVLAVKWLRATGRQTGGPALFLVGDESELVAASPNVNDSAPSASSSSRPASLRGGVGGVGSGPPRRRRTQTRRLSPEYVLYTLFASNLVGICFARTLHYQFYSWYCHTVPFLLWSSSSGVVLPLPARMAVWAAMEYAFNVYPATSLSSAVLQVAHFAVLAMVLISPVPRVLMANDDGGGGGGGGSGSGAEGGKPTTFQL